MITRRRPHAHTRVYKTGRRIRINKKLRPPKKARKIKVVRSSPDYFIISKRVGWG